MSQQANEALQKLNESFATFKEVNDKRLEQIEKRGAADPLTEGAVQKLNDQLDVLQKEVVSLKTPKSSVNEDGNLEEKEYKNAFDGYLRKGSQAALELKAMSADSDPNGGYLVPRTLSSSIAKKIFETSPMRNLATVETISGDGLDIIVDNSEMATGWASEQSTRSETTSATVGKKTIMPYELYAQPKATQKLIDDAAIDIEAWISDKLADAMSRAENTAFISGADGSSKPRGILTYTAGTSWGQIEQVVSGTSATITGDGLISLLYALKEDYQKNSTFLMARSSVGAVRKLKDVTSGQYIWQPGLTSGAPDQLLGRPLVMASDMPVAAANSLSVAVADFKRAYTIVDKVGMRILRDPFTDKPFVKFYTTKRVGGDVVNFEAIKLLKLSA